MNTARATINVKGQFVIPVLMRKYWDITPDTQIDIISTPGVGITLKPVKTKEKISNTAYLKILAETQGAWADDDWPETEAKYNKIEKKAAQKLKNSW